MKPAGPPPAGRSAPRGVWFANIVLAGGGLISALGLGYATYYREIFFTGPAGLTLCYLFPAAWAVLSFGALRLSPPRRLNVALVFLSVAASIYAGEVLLDLLTTIGKARSNYDHRTPLQVVLELRRAGVDAYPSLWPTLFLDPRPKGPVRSAITIDGAEVVPLAGITDKVVVACNETGQLLSYHSDEFGFHNPGGVWRADAHVAAVGDSFTLGYCVPSDRNFVAIIRNRYPLTLNLSSIGNGPLVELATMKEYLEPVKPRLVLWCYYEGNDLENLHVESRSPLLMRYLTDGFSQGLATRRTDVDRWLAAYAEPLIAEAAARDASTGRGPSLVARLAGIARLPKLRQSSLTLFDREGPVADADVVLLGRTLRQAKAMTAAWGGRLYFVYLPEWQRYKTLARTNGRREEVLRLIDEIGLPIIDVHQAFLRQPDPLALFAWRRFASHYNAEGHRVVAEAVLKVVGAGSEELRAGMRPVR